MERFTVEGFLAGWCSLSLIVWGYLGIHPLSLI